MAPKSSFTSSNKLEKLLMNVGDMSLKRRARRIIESLNPQPLDKIIDLGCGTGYYLFLLSSLPVKLHLFGFDNDKKAINEAKNVLSDKNIKYEVGDLHKIPYKNNTFDKAVMSEVLEHVGDDNLVLKEIHRILRPNGTLVISVPSYNFPFFWDPVNWLLERLSGTHVKKGFWSGIWNQHLRLYKKEELEKKIKQAGFKLEKAEELTFWCLPFNHYLVNLVARLLYDYRLPTKIVNSISKFKETKKPLILRLVFFIINSIDSLNNIISMENGVNVFVVAKK